MWSNIYVYYNIQSDETCSKDIKTENIVNIFSEYNFLKKYIGNRCFENKEEFSWIKIYLTFTKDGKNFMSDTIYNDRINIIPIITTREAQSNYFEFMLEIANKINWKLFLEEDDDHTENIEIIKTDDFSEHFYATNFDHKWKGKKQIKQRNGT